MCSMLILTQYIVQIQIFCNLNVVKYPNSVSLELQQQYLVIHFGVGVCHTSGKNPRNLGENLTPVSLYVCLPLTKQYG